MPTVLRLRRNDTPEAALITGADGEICVDTGKQTLRVHNGTLPGGTLLATEAFVTPTARLAMSVTDTGGDGSLSYNNLTGVFTYTGPSPSEVRAHFSAATSGFGSLTYSAATGVFTYSGPTATQVRSNFSATTSGFGSLTYNNSTGVFAYTGPSATEIRGNFSVTDTGGDGSLSYNSTTGVFTYTGPSAAEVRAHFTAGAGITITSGAIASTITQYTDALAKSAIFKSVPATATSPGAAGDIAADATHLYICVAGNTWRRVAVEAW